MNLTHDSYQYKVLRQSLKSGKHNGAYYYSKEIVKNIIPAVKTDRPWVTIRVGDLAYDHAIVFIHKNVHLETYQFLSKYKDLILVCSNHDTAHHLQQLGKTIFIPMNVDVKYVEKFKLPEHDRENVYCGNKWSFKKRDLDWWLPKNCDTLTNLPRKEMLTEMAHYKKVYAVGRCAIEAKILGAELGFCDSRYPDTSFWKVVDNSEAAQMLQQFLNYYDKGESNGYEEENF